MSGNPTPCDPNAGGEAVQLLLRLHAQVGNGVLFGHQDTAAYGVGWTNGEKNSDIGDAVGRWPAVYGWDIGGIETGAAENLDGVSFESMARYIVDADRRGGIVTISYHQRNPATGESAWDNSPCVESILPGGERHDEFVAGPLDRMADFLDSLRRDDGAHVPLVLRPYHERNQTWSWWGAKACNPDDYVKLWHMTVDHLRDSRGLHHLLYCFSPQDVTAAEDYLVGYPGDDYVDVLGLDFYKVWEESQIEMLSTALHMVNGIAKEKGKVAALTETGVENVPIKDWFTKYLVAAVTATEDTRRTVWALVWRNANEEHFFAPFVGHPALENFKEMLASNEVVMGVSLESKDLEEQPETVLLENSPFVVR